MFAAASGARLAHRHNKVVVKKQISTSQIEGLQIHYKAFQRQQQLKYQDHPGVHGGRYTSLPQRKNTTRLYTDSEPLNLSTSYVDLNGRLSKLGTLDYEGKAAWQDRELPHEEERRDSAALSSDNNSNYRCKQKEAHRRWVKRNRIHDTSFGDCSSDDDELYGYGVQSAAANALLYIGLGTMCVGMIIAFVGTGEKGFKTMELRLIGPSLIGAGLMIIVLRVMLCVCPSKCLRLNKHKHKHKNSTNKLNSEGEVLSPAPEEAADRAALIKPEEAKKRVSIATIPTTSKTIPIAISIPPEESIAKTISFLESERGRGSARPIPAIRIPNFISSDEEGDGKSFELAPLDNASFDLSFGSERLGAHLESEMSLSRAPSDLSITSLANGLANSETNSESSVKTVKNKNTSKFESHRTPMNAFQKELVLSPSNLEELCENDLFGKETK